MSKQILPFYLYEHFDIRSIRVQNRYMADKSNFYLWSMRTLGCEEILILLDLGAAARFRAL